jgi:single-stranded-DNA-specific exonuclease
MADRLEELLNGDGNYCLAFTPKVNTWNGSRKIELEVHDMKPGKSVPLG